MTAAEPPGRLSDPCFMCGRYVLQVPGWTARVMAYRMLRSPWDADAAFLGDTALHFSCLRTFVHRDEFRADLVEMLTSADHDIEVLSEGHAVTARRPGMAFTERVFAGSSGEVFRHVNTDSWVFVEKDGPWHFLEAKDLKELAVSGTLRLSSGGEPALPPARPEGRVNDWPFATLLDFLRVRDLYQEVLDTLDPEYSVIAYTELPLRFLLEYLIACTQPLPEELARFAATPKLDGRAEYTG